MSYEIDISNRQTAIPVNCEQLAAAIKRALQIEDVASAVLSVSLVDNAAIHKINRDHLEHDCPTDVISFQLEFRLAERHDDVEGDDESDFEHQWTEDSGSNEYLEEDSDDDSDHLSSEDMSEAIESQATPVALAADSRAASAMIEGEIVASVEMASQMAAEANWSQQAELTLYVVHGMLHICGYDDLTDDERVIMRAREAAIMSSLGLR